MTVLREHSTFLQISIIIQMQMIIPLRRKVVNVTVLKFEYNDVTLHLYWPWCLDSTDSIV